MKIEVRQCVFCNYICKGKKYRYDLCSKHLSLLRPRYGSSFINIKQAVLLIKKLKEETRKATLQCGDCKEQMQKALFNGVMCLICPNSEIAQAYTKSGNIVWLENEVKE